MGACMPICFFREVCQKTDDEFIGDFEELDNFCFIRVFDYSDNNTMNEMVEVVDSYRVDSVSLKAFEGCSNDEELR